MVRQFSLIFQSLLGCRCCTRGRRPKRGALRQNPTRQASGRILTPLVQSPATPPKSREHFCILT